MPPYCPQGNSQSSRGYNGVVNRCGVELQVSAVATKGVFSDGRAAEATSTWIRSIGKPRLPTATPSDLLRQYRAPDWSRRNQATWRPNSETGTATYGSLVGAVTSSQFRNQVPKF